MILLAGLSSLPLLLVIIAVVVIFFAAAAFVLSKAPEPIKGWGWIILVLIAAIFLIIFLLGLVGIGPGVTLT